MTSSSSLSIETLDLSGITYLTLDSRQVRAGCAFLALPGERVDGARFAQEAADKGAVAILMDAATDPRLIPHGPRLWLSNDPRADAARLAARFYGPGPTHCGAVTGTNGKTSVAWFTQCLLSAAGLKAMSAGTLGLLPEGLGTLPPLTSPDAVSLHSALQFATQRGYEHLIIEASSHGLDQRRLQGLQFEAAAFTNLTQDHLDYHGTMAAYFAAKRRLLALLTPTGTAIINADDPNFAEINGWTYGFSGREGKILKAEPTGGGIQLQTADFDIEMPLIGTFQGHNLVCAWLMARAMGQETTDHLSAAIAVPGRMESVAKHCDGGLMVVDYAHTPDALETALRALRPHVAGRLICVFGAGGNRDTAKRPLMGAAAARHGDLSIITDDNPRNEDPALIRAAIAAAAPEAEQIADRETAIARALEISRAGDVILVAGKGHEQGQTLGTTTRPFDDRSVSRALAAQTSAWSPLP